ncbi:nuclear transport factor 2 family protein [Pedobacter kyonggii]|uniref:Nuclear transport factor 2 family protein n=1 Tax=Pedobacter kyonggii TaxID=1926871 RepID=A0A4Q9H928_9SPHI|nr:nuclear transport factor 2 family protein [Pedobacter kyonggii]TBO40439.1 nuclear transport factor 2 family protein [Pedobacter kyonggii]
MSKENKEILLTANSFIKAGNHEGFLSLCTDDLVWEFIGDQILSGKDAVRKYMDEVYLEPPVFEVQNLISENNSVIAIGKITLKNENGESVAYSYCDIWELREGRLKSLKAFVIKA